MNVTIKFIVLCNILCSLGTMSMYIDRSDSENSGETIIKLPRTITYGSVMVVKGTFNSTVDSLKMTVLGENLEKKEECQVTLEPSESATNWIIEAKSIGESTKTSYNLSGAGNKQLDGIVPFTFKFFAPLKDEVETDTIHIDFEGNNAGPISLETPCIFSSFKNVDKITFRGSKQIKSLLFDYKE